MQLSLDLREQLGDPRRIPSGQVALAQAELTAGHRDRAIDLLRVAVLQAREAGLLAQRIEDAERALREAEAAPDTGTEDLDATARSDSNTAPTASPLRQAVPAIDGTSEPEIWYSPDSPGPVTSDHQNAHVTGESGSGGSSPIVTSADGRTSKIAAVIWSPIFDVFAVNAAGPGPRRGQVIWSTVNAEKWHVTPCRCRF